MKVDSKRFKRSKDHLPYGMEVVEARMRFWARVAKRPISEEICWNWLGATSNSGHGRFKYFGKLISPHRFAYECYFGKIPETIEGKEAIVRHKCDNGLCCNPRHLELGTRRDNALDIVKRGNHPWKKK